LVCTVPLVEVDAMATSQHEQLQQQQQLSTADDREHLVTDVAIGLTQRQHRKVITAHVFLL
jgi:hypothetical protein